MAGKIGKVILTIVVSLVFFIPAAILLDSLAGIVFGNKANGDAIVNGHIMLLITTVITIAFGVCFYKYVHLSKNRKSKVSDKI